MNESPSWAAGQGDLTRAAEILRKSYGVDAVAVEAPRTTPPRPSFTRLFNRTYRLRTTLALAVALAQTFGYNAVAYGLPVIIAGFLAQGPLTTITAALVLNLGFAVTGGLLGIRFARTQGAWRMTVLGFAVQLLALVVLAVVGRPATTTLVFAAIAALGGFLFAQAWGPGANYMTFATLSYPTSLRGVGVGFNQGVLRIGSTLSLFLFPILSASFGTGVFWIIALAPALGLLALLLIRWEPVGYDVDAEDDRATVAA